MTYSFATATLPILISTLRTLDGYIDKAVASAAARKIDAAIFVQGRLAPDMWPLVRQAQVVCDFGAKTTARLAGIEPPSHPDVETSFAELKTRIAAVIAYIESVSADKIDGREEDVISFPVDPNTMKMKASDYFSSFALPNIMFHTDMVYAILRHNGVDIGKKDVLATMMDKVIA
jgi:uncharacterized protein